MCESSHSATTNSRRWCSTVRFRVDLQSARPTPRISTASCDQWVSEGKETRTESSRPY
jgi:hypothetical protein